MDNQFEEIKASVTDGLTQQEQQDIFAIFEKDSYQGLGVQQAKEKLTLDLLEQEKKSITEYSLMSKELEQICDELGRLDHEFKSLEQTVDGQTLDYLDIIRELKSCQNQTKIIDTKIKNTQDLQETLELIGGKSDFSEELVKSLTEPNFNKNKVLDESLKSLRTIGRYIKNSDRFQNNELMMEKQKLCNTYFEKFIKKYKEHFKQQCNDSLRDYEKYLQIQIETPGLNFILNRVLPTKFVVQAIFEVQDENYKFLAELIDYFKSQLKKYLEKALAIFEQQWNNKLQEFEIFKKKINILSTDEINIQNLNASVKGESNLAQFIERVVQDQQRRIEDDQRQWPGFFHQPDKKDYKEQIEALVQDTYKSYMIVYEKIISKSIDNSSVAIFFFLSAYDNFLSRKEIQQKIENDDEYSGLDGIKYIKQAIEYKSSSFVENLKKQINSVSVEPKNPGLQLPTKNFAIIAKAFQSLYFSQIKDKITSDIKQIYEELKKWLFKEEGKVAKLNKKEKGFLLIENSAYLKYQFQKIQDPLYKYMRNDMIQVFKEFSNAYFQELFCDSFKDFTEYWYKIKEIGEQDIGSKLTGKYDKYHFLGFVKNTFSNFVKGLEKMVSKVNKKFKKDPILLKEAYGQLIIYMDQEYSSIQEFSMNAYKEGVTPTISDIRAILIQKVK